MWVSFDCFLPHTQCCRLNISFHDNLCKQMCSDRNLTILNCIGLMITVNLLPGLPENGKRWRKTLARSHQANRILHAEFASESTTDPSRRHPTACLSSSCVLPSHEHLVLFEIAEKSLFSQSSSSELTTASTTVHASRVWNLCISLHFHIIILYFYQNNIDNSTSCLKVYITRNVIPINK